MQAQIYVIVIKCLYQCSSLYMNMCLHIVHMQSLRGTGYAKLLLTRRLAHCAYVADRPGNSVKFESVSPIMYIGWLSKKHKQIYFLVSFVKQTINKRRKHCTCNNKRTMVCCRSMEPPRLHARTHVCIHDNTFNKLTLSAKKVGGQQPPLPPRLRGPCS